MTITAEPDHAAHTTVSEPGMPLAVSVQFYAEDTVVVTAVGEIDAATAAKLDSVAAFAITELSSRLVFDFTGAGFLGVAGLDTVATTFTQGRISGVEVVVAGPQVPVGRALELLEEPPRLYKTLSAALRSGKEEAPGVEPAVLRASAE